MKKISFLVCGLLWLCLLSGVESKAYTTKETCSREASMSGSVSEVITVDYVYYNHGTNSNHHSGFSYSDDMLLADAVKDNSDPDPEIAKMSVALASLAYVGKTSITDTLLKGMKYDSVVLYDYERQATYEDNDFVAYSVAKKEITVNSEKYVIYLVPVRGTPGSGEWYSDFRLGKNNGGNHEGFYKAADGIYDSLVNDFFAQDGADSLHRKILVTGHSRGAAVANIVAGKLTRGSYVSQSGVFGYTFACPAVSKKADATLKNIYNFNNQGDLIPELPLETWGYKRYGQTVGLDTSNPQYGNFLNRFQDEASSNYLGSVSGKDTALDTLTDFVPTESAFTSSEAQLAFDIVAYGLGGKNDSDKYELADIFARHQITISEQILNKAFSSNPMVMIHNLRKQLSEDDELIGQIDEAYGDTDGMSTEEFSEWMSSHYTLRQKIYQITNISIKKRSDLLLAKTEIAAENTQIGKISSVVINIVELLLSTDGKLKEFITHGHAPVTYMLWINSMYYGYKGWYGYDKVGGAKVAMSSDVKVLGKDCFQSCKALGGIVLSEKVSVIPEYCFYGCTGLKELEIPGAVRQIRAWACCNTGIEKLVINGGETELYYACFARNGYLKEITLPADVKYITSTGLRQFEGTPVEKVHYTKGNTGKIPDRNQKYYDDVDTLEYYMYDTVTEIDFEEGITEIGNHFLCKSWDDKYTKLSSIKLPNTLKRIGDYAFNDITSEVSVELGENVEELGEGCFRDSTGLTGINIPGKVSVIPDYCFSGCTGLKAVQFPKGLKEIANSGLNNRSLTVYAYDGTYGKEWADKYNKEFIPLQKPLISADAKTVRKGGVLQFAAKVYTGIDKYTDEVAWLVENADSEETIITNGGLLSVASEEKAEYLNVYAVYEDEKVGMEIKIVSDAISTQVPSPVPNPSPGAKPTVVPEATRKPAPSEIPGGEQATSPEPQTPATSPSAKPTAVPDETSRPTVFPPEESTITSKPGSGGVTPSVTSGTGSQMGSVNDSSAMLSQSSADTSTLAKDKSDAADDQAVNILKKSVIKSAKNQKGRKIAVVLGTVKGASGYRIQYATNKKFEGAKTRTTSKIKLTIKKLKKKTYYIRVCAYWTGETKKVHGKWSAIKKVRVRK